MAKYSGRHLALLIGPDGRIIAMNLQGLTIDLAVNKALGGK